MIRLRQAAPLLLIGLAGCAGHVSGVDERDGAALLDAASIQDAAPDSFVADGAGPDAGRADAGDGGVPNLPSCLDGAERVERFEGAMASAVTRNAGSLPNGGVLDFSEATVAHPPWYPVAIKVNGAGEPSNACIHGGFAHHTASSWSRLNASWLENYTQNHASFVHEGSNGILEWSAAFNSHDPHRANGGRGPFTVRDVWFNYTRDDCSENDQLRPATFERVLFDGCYVAFSTRPGKNDTSSSGAGKTGVVVDSLVRLEPMPGPAKWNESAGAYLRLPGYRDHGGYFGHGNVFKGPSANRQLTWSFRGHNIFYLVDGGKLPSHYDFPAKIASCEDITIIWLGDGTRYGKRNATDYPGNLRGLPTMCRSFEVITDPVRGRAVWEDAVNQWFADHPDVGAYREGLPRSVPTRPAPGAYRIPPFPRYDP